MKIAARRIVAERFRTDRHRVRQSVRCELQIIKIPDALGDGLALRIQQRDQAAIRQVAIRPPGVFRGKLIKVFGDARDDAMNQGVPEKRHPPDDDPGPDDGEGHGRQGTTDEGSRKRLEGVIQSERETPREPSP